MSNKTTSAHMTRSESPGLSSGPELFIGLVGAVGSDMDRVSETLSRALREVGYTYDPVLRLSELLHDIPELSLPETKGAFERNTLLDERYDRYMTAANKLRRDTARG